MASSILRSSSKLLRNHLVNNVTSKSSRGFASSAGQTLTSLATENPHVEVIRYEHKNVKWTVGHVDYFSDALAIGLLENGLAPGDSVLSWLPSHFSEQHILQFACSKAGLILYHLDPTVDKTLDHAKLCLSKALEVSEASVLVSQDTGNDVRYTDLVKQVIPETRIFDFQEGMPFFTPRFPHLRFPIHTGFDEDKKHGFLLLKHMLVPSENLSEHLEDCELSDTTPLVGEFKLDHEGVPVGKGEVLSNKQVLLGESSVWPQMQTILKKDYTEVEGVGVIF